MSFCLLAFLFDLAPYLGHAADITIGWDKCPEADIAGYKIHYGTTSGNYAYSVDVGNYGNCSISGLVEGQTYYFAASSYTVDNIESEFSKELVHTIPASQTSLPASGADEVKIWIEAEYGTKIDRILVTNVMSYAP